MKFDFFEHKGILHFFFSMSYTLGQDFFFEGSFFLHFAKVFFKKGLKKIMSHCKVNEKSWILTVVR
jgi:hypothetical protein